MTDVRDLWRPFLERADFVVLDGGLATELERHGADLRDPLWSARVLLENPTLLRKVHDDYLAAGADVLITASYQATFAGLGARGLDRSAATQVLRDSVRIAQSARDEFGQRCPQRVRPLVAASVGSYGAALHDGSEFRGNYGLTAAQLAEWHGPRFAVLAESGADLLACETIPCRAEAEALVQLAREFHRTPLWLSFSCRDESRVCHGETLAECAALTNGQANVVAVGVNCTSPYLVEPLLRSLAGVTDVPRLAYPNSGETWDAVARRWCATGSSGDWASWAQTWVAAGATLIGGCCRTTPTTIATIAGARRRRA